MNGTARRNGWLVSVAAVIVAAILAIVVVLGGSGALFGTHTSCQAGPIAAQQSLWTPLLIVNSPYGGDATGLTTVYNSPTSTINVSVPTLVNGSVGAVFYLDDWALVSLSNSTIGGPGTNLPCTSSYRAVDLSWSQYGDTSLAVHTLYLAGEGTRADEHLPQQISVEAGNGTLYESVLFNDSFAPGVNPENETFVSTCGIPNSLILNSTSEWLSFRVPFFLNGVVLTPEAALSLPTEYNYIFPGSTGGWNATDAIHSTHFSGGGLAFSFTSCSSMG